MRRDRAVGVVTGCGLDGPGIESRWGRDFPHQSQPAQGPTSYCKLGKGSLFQGKVAGAWR